MKKGSIGAGVGAACLAIVLVASASLTRARAEGSGNSEKQVAMKDLPSAVYAAAEKAIAGGSLKRVVMEEEDGQVAYSVEATVRGTTKEFTFATDGSLLTEEEDVAFAKLPEAVRAAAEKYFGGSRDLRASMEVAKHVTSYEIAGHKGGKTMSATFSAAGALREEEEDGD